MGSAAGEAQDAIPCTGQRRHDTSDTRHVRIQGRPTRIAHAERNAIRWAAISDTPVRGARPAVCGPGPRRRGCGRRCEGLLSQFPRRAPLALSGGGRPVGPRWRRFRLGCGSSSCGGGSVASVRLQGLCAHRLGTAQRERSVCVCVCARSGASARPPQPRQLRFPNMLGPQRHRCLHFHSFHISCFGCALLALLSPPLNVSSHHSGPFTRACHAYVVHLACAFSKRR